MKKHWVLIEVIGDGPRFDDRYDSWICPWSDLGHYVTTLLEGNDIAQIVSLRLTVMEMTEEEFETYCDEEGIEYTP